MVVRLTSSFFGQPGEIIHKTHAFDYVVRRKRNLRIVFTNRRDYAVRNANAMTPIVRSATHINRKDLISFLVHVQVIFSGRNVSRMIISRVWSGQRCPSILSFVQINDRLCVIAIDVDNSPVGVEA
jgi:hypothetical protein